MFWSDTTSIEPLRQYRWLLSNGAGVWVWAKSVKLPQFAIETQRYQIINHKINYPGLLEWQDVSVTIVDIQETKTQGKNIVPEGLTTSNQLFDQMVDSGYNVRGALDGFSKKKMAEKTKTVFGFESQDFTISQINSEGIQLQKWVLYHALIKDVSFGQLDYSSDELITLDLTITYDYAELLSETI